MDCFVGLAAFWWATLSCLPAEYHKLAWPAGRWPTQRSSRCCWLSLHWWEVVAEWESHLWRACALQVFKQAVVVRSDLPDCAACWWAAFSSFATQHRMVAWLLLGGKHIGVEAEALGYGAESANG